MEQKKRKKIEMPEAENILEKLDDLYLDFLQYEHIHSALKGTERAIQLRQEMNERIEKDFPHLVDSIREQGEELTLADKMKIAELSDEFQDAMIRGRLFYDNDLYRDPVYAKNAEDLSSILSDGVFCRSAGEMHRQGDLGERRKRYRKDEPELTAEDQEELNGLEKKGNEYRKYKERYSRTPAYFTKMRDEPWTIRFEKEAESRTFAYVPFDPDIELKKISGVGKSENGRVDPRQRTEKKKDMLTAYMKNLMKQKEGIANLQVALEKEIRGNPEITLRELKEIIYQNAPACRLTWPQISNFFEGAKKYVRDHETINEYWKNYSSSEELFQVCFGFLPKGKVEVLKGSVTIHFRCFDENDYAAIYNRKKAEDVAPEDLQKISESGGVYLAHAGPWSLEGCLSAEKCGPKDSGSWGTFLHEEQHSIKNFFYDKHSFDHIELRAADDTEVKKFMKRLRKHKQDFEESAKNEILAYFKTGTVPEYLKVLLLNNASYDYIGNWINGFEGKFDINEALKVGLFQEDVIQIFSKVLRDEYRREVSEAIESLCMLQELGFEREEVMRLLGTEPLARWPKILYRLTKYDISVETEMREEILLACRKGQKFSKVKKWMAKNMFSERQKKIIEQALGVAESMRSKGMPNKDIVKKLENEPLINWPAASKINL
jgi:hypothetical protein